MKPCHPLLGLTFLLLGIATTLAQTTPPPSAPPASAPATSTTSAPTTNVALAGLSDHANRIVYIIDHSGSLLDIFRFMSDDLRASVANLYLDQQFNVLALSENTAVLGPQRELTPASAKNKDPLLEKLKELRAQGMNDDRLSPFDDAFIRAFSMKPQVIFFATDGHIDPNLLKVIAKLNKDRKVRIHILQYSVADKLTPQEAASRQLMQQIAKDNDGQYKLHEARLMPRQ